MLRARSSIRRHCRGNSGDCGSINGAWDFAIVCAVFRHIPWLASVALLVSCSNKDDSVGSPARKVPPTHAEIPAALSIAVSVQGKESEPVTGKTLAALAPDFSDENRRAWRLTRVLGQRFQAPTASVEAKGTDGKSFSQRRPIGDEEPTPVLLLTRRGQIAATVVSPEDPFPAHHGKGRRRGRSLGDAPLVVPVKELVISNSHAGHGAMNSDRMPPARNPRLEATFNGKPFALPDELWTKTPQLSSAAAASPRWRIWSARDLAENVGGPQAWVRSIASKTARRTLSPKDWKNLARTPALRVSREGEVEFVWLDKRGAPSDDPLLRVTRLELVSENDTSAAQ